MLSMVVLFHVFLLIIKCFSGKICHWLKILSIIFLLVLVTDFFLIQVSNTKAHLLNLVELGAQLKPRSELSMLETNKYTKSAKDQVCVFKVFGPFPLKQLTQKVILSDVQLKTILHYYQQLNH